MMASTLLINGSMCLWHMNRLLNASQVAIAMI